MAELSAELAASTIVRVGVERLVSHLLLFAACHLGRLVARLGRFPTGADLLEFLSVWVVQHGSNVAVGVLDVGHLHLEGVEVQVLTTRAKVYEAGAVERRPHHEVRAVTDFLRELKRQVKVKRILQDQVISDPSLPVSNGTAQSVCDTTWWRIRLPKRGTAGQTYAFTCY